MINTIQIRILLVVASLIGTGALGFIGYQWYQISQLEQDVVNRDLIITEQNQTIGTLRAAEEVNVATIEGLEQDLEEQSQSIARLETSRNTIAAERDRYLSIFREHDLTNLALRRPGLIEPLINNGTRDVFDQLEQDTEELNERYQNPSNNADSTNG
jgi:cell division protein FtsB